MDVGIIDLPGNVEFDEDRGHGQAYEVNRAPYFDVMSMLISDDSS